jgi:hypothetical protein
MNLRDFLDRREKDLGEQLAEWKRRAIPLEAELAEIRRASRALGAEAHELRVHANGLRRYLERREKELLETIDEIGAGAEDLQTEFAEVRKVKSAIGLIPAKEFSVGDSCDTPLAEWESVPEAVGIPYQSLTIKELVLKALREHFPNGATIAQLIEFFRDKWGRDIDRPSLSPQLSRLYAAGQITQFGNRREWHLMPEKPPGIAGMHPFLTREGIIWKYANQASERDLPAKLRETSRPELDDEADVSGHPDT